MAGVMSWLGSMASAAMGAVSPRDPAASEAVGQKRKRADGDGAPPAAVPALTKRETKRQRKKKKGKNKGDPRSNEMRQKLNLCSQKVRWWHSRRCPAGLAVCPRGLAGRACPPFPRNPASAQMDCDTALEIFDTCVRDSVPLDRYMCNMILALCATFKRKDGVCRGLPAPCRSRPVFACRAERSAYLVPAPAPAGVQSLCTHARL